ncbi:MAG TPA: ferredoxin-NADP reductase, partial [Alphaproteobacteria bacterium]|nr:ferredoxin-NADP reductase [Alphaproteobacteria bacterium]
DPEVEAALASAPLAGIHIVGRRGPGDTGFSPNELAELGTLARAEPVVDAADLPPGDGPALAVLRDFAARAPAGKPVPIRFHFHATAQAFLGTDRVEAVRFARAGGAFTLPADLVVTCIGYGASGCCELAASGGVFDNVDGRIADGLYVVGWAKRGPSGTIAANRAESHDVAKRILGEATEGGREGASGLARLLSERGAKAVDSLGWKRIDAAEFARAGDGRIRRKFTRLDELLAASEGA